MILSGQRAFLIPTHQTAVTGHIRRQYRRQPPFYALTGHRIPLGRQIRLDA